MLATTITTTSRLLNNDTSSPKHKTVLPNHLLTNTESFLSNCPVKLRLSADENPYLITESKQMYVYPPDYMGLCLSGNKIKNHESKNPGGKINVLFTPMRPNDSTFRLAQPDKCVLGDNSLWLTTPQTGCVVAVIKWPLNAAGEHEYSMLHLQPNNWADQPEIAEKLRNMIAEGNTEEVCAFQDRYLQQELLAIFESIATQNEIQPESYAVSFSSLDYQCLGKQTQVLGIIQDNDIAFYEQKVGYNGSPEVKPLSFTSWNNFSSDISRDPEFTIPQGNNETDILDRSNFNHPGSGVVHQKAGKSRTCTLF